MKNVIQKIEAAVLNFLNRVEHKLPVVLEKGGAFGLNLTLQAEAILNGTKAGELMALVPATAPFAPEIQAVLKELEIAFKAIENAGLSLEGKALNTKGPLFMAAGKIASIQDGNKLPLNRYNLAVQIAYSKHPASAANAAA